MSLAQYASPYNNDDSEETSNINTNIRITQSQNQNQNRGRGGGGGGGAEKKMPLRKTIKRPLAQQEKQQQGVESPPSRVANFMSKLSAVKNINHVQSGGDDGTSGLDESETDIADYQPMNYEGGQNSNSNNNDEDGVVTRENFENLPSTYASQYYQQYVPFSYRHDQNNVESSVSPGSRDDLMQKMNHIIQMLEDQQDEKTGSVTEELILYCFLGVFVIFVVDSFVRAGKYVR